ncbi:MAG: amylo-alpha-1,6-glucosidase [bacterium]
MIQFGPEICHDFTVASKKEWLETNGIGGYASSTLVLTNTRRYHGLLVVARTPPCGRAVLLSKLDESLILRGGRYDLHTNQYPDIVYPHGHQYLESLRLDPFPVWTYRVPGGLLEKSLFLVHGEHTLVVIYRLSGETSALLEVRPLFAYRAFHDLAHENESLNRVPNDAGSTLSVTPFAGMPPVSISHGGTFRSEGYWYKNFEYVEEAYRGYSFREDLYAYGSWTRTLEPGKEIALVVSTADAASMDAFLLRDRERARRHALVPGADDADGATDRAGALRIAADQFLVRRQDHLASVIAGYPWYAEGARDAAIALPGLTLTTERFPEARDIIRGLLLHLEAGFLPASFPEEGAASGARPPSVDTALWLLVAVHEYLRATSDRAFVKDEVAAPLLNAIALIREGGARGVRCDADGLLVVEPCGAPMTWMNGKVGDWLATERAGKSVEVCALWVNALAIGAELAEILGRHDEEESLVTAGAHARDGFENAFWNPAAGYLRDTVREGVDDTALRPNQVIALGLPHAVLGEAESRRALSVVREKLWTPYGLRSLAPEDALYRGKYIGDAWLREKAYHQGSVWPWLLGSYVRAWLRVDGRVAIPHLRSSLEFLEAHLLDGGVGSISELFDGDEPHAARGAFSSAAAVAECLRASADLAAMEESPAR